MANKAIFLKNGYSIVSESGNEQLLVKQFREGRLPSLYDRETELKNTRV